MDHHGISMNIIKLNDINYGILFRLQNHLTRSQQNVTNRVNYPGYEQGDEGYMDE